MVTVWDDLSLDLQIVPALTVCASYWRAQDVLASTTVDEVPADVLVVHLEEPQSYLQSWRSVCESPAQICHQVCFTPIALPLFFLELQGPSQAAPVGTCAGSDGWKAPA